MSTPKHTEGESRILPEAVHNLRDRLKHGQHVTKILESQLDTAQQNISLLQGQVRLANETIVNLKKHFRETENILSQLVSGSGASNFDIGEEPTRYRSPDSKGDQDSNDLKQQSNSSVDSTTHSPKPVSAFERPKSRGVAEDRGPERSKSPYAQQLRQVLDALDDEPRKVSIHQPEHNKDSCNCSECQQSQKKSYMDGSPHAEKCSCGKASCDYHVSGHREEHSRHDEPHSRHDDHMRHTDEHMRHSDDYHKIKSHVNGHTMHEHSKPYSTPGRSVSSSSIVHPTSSPYSHHCSGPCCVKQDISPHHGGYKLMEKPPPGSVHYVSVHSPMHRLSESTAKHVVGDHHHMPGHCGEKCQCHAFVNYAPYGYHIVESAPGIPESIEPISPSARPRKRPHIPLLPGEEPPHLKYTKVKRIDGSKLTAQKTLQDFTKRRYLPYNPRYDLDLLIVPPPIPAMDLLKGRVTETEHKYPLQPQPLPARPAMIAMTSPPPEVRPLEGRPMEGRAPMVSIVNPPIEGSLKREGDENIPPPHTTTIFTHTPFKAPVEILPMIKEEQSEKSQREDILLKERHDPNISLKERHDSNSLSTSEHSPPQNSPHAMNGTASSNSGSPTEPYQVSSSAAYKIVDPMGRSEGIPVTVMQHGAVMQH